MWFKQARIYQLAKPIAYDADALTAALQPLSYTPCLPSFASSHGFAAPIDLEEAPLVHAANGFLLVCLQMEDKILPATVVRQAVEDQVKKTEAEQSRKVSRKEKLDLKDEMTQTLLPRAFSKFTRLYAYIDTNNNFLVINSDNNARIEMFEKLFLRCCDGQKLKPMLTKKIAYVLTQWLLQGGIPQELSIEESCVLRDPDQQSRNVRCQHQDLFSDGVSALLKDSHEVSQIALRWQDRINFNLTENFTLRSIKYSDSLVEAAKNHYGETQAQRFDADFYLMSETLSNLWQDLLGYFGKDEN